MDFAHDTLGDGRAIRIFAVVDDFTRTCTLLLVDLALPAVRVTGALDWLAASTTLPATLACDYGSEFTSHAFDQGAHARGITLPFIRSGRPDENAYAESFNGRLRDECLNERWFVMLAYAQRTIEAWRLEYNTGRPHPALAQGRPGRVSRSGVERQPRR